MSAVSNRMAGWWGAVVLVGGIVAAAGALQTAAGHEMLRQVGLFEDPGGYTSLAFVHPKSVVEEQLVSQRSAVTLKFVIHNAGSTTHTYQWSVLLVRAGHARRVDTGSLSLASGREASVTRPEAIACTRGRLQIVVSLARPAESIDAWTACWSPRS